jgi:hypothetical protein
MSGSNEQQQPQAPPDLNAAIQALIQQQIAAASGQGNQVQLPSAQPPPSQYSNDPSKGPGLLARIGLALGGGSLPGAPAELRAQMGAQALMNFGTGLMSAGRFSTPGEVLAGGFRGAQQGLLGSEAAQAGQQEYALNAQTKLAELGMEQQKNRTAALTALVPLLQMQGRLGLPPLFGPGSGGGGAAGGGGPGGGGGPDTSIGDVADKQDFLTKFAPIAQQVADKTGLPANYVTGQAGLETGWGTSNAAKNNNFFGISGPDGKPLSYRTPQEGIDAYVSLMSSDRYKNVPRTGSPQQIGDAMAVAGYNPNVPRQGSTDSYGARVGAFTGSIPARSASGGGGPGSAVGPYKVASTGNVPPPSAPPSSGLPGGLPEPPQPPAEGVPLPGDSGLRRYPDGSVGTPGQEGRPVITAAQAPGGQIAPPADAQPTLGPVGPITPPAATLPAATAQPPEQPAQPPVQPPPAAQPPAPTPAPASRAHDYSVPDTELNPEEYQDRHFVPLTADQVKTYAPGPAGDLAAAAADQVQRERDNLRVQQTQLERMNRGAIPADAAAVARQDGQVTDAQKALDAAENSYNDQVQKLAQSGASNLLNRDNAERARVSADYKASVIDPRNAAAIEQQRQQGEINKDVNLQVNQQWGKIIEQSQKNAGAARNVRDQLEPAIGLMSDQPTNAFVRNMLDHDTDGRFAATLKGLGIADPMKVDARTQLNGILSYVTTEMKPAGLGALRVQEMNAIRSGLGSGTLDPATQRLMMARILNLQDRIMNEADASGELWQQAIASGKPGQGLGTAQKDIDAKLGPVIHNAATEMNPADLADPTKVNAWMHGAVAPNRPVYVPKYDKNGQLVRGASGNPEVEMKVSR